MDEGFELGAEGVELFDGELLDVDEICVVELSGVGDLAGADARDGIADGFEIALAAGDRGGALAVVEGDEGVGRKEAEAALGLEGEARGGEVGDAAAGEREAGI